MAIGKNTQCSTQNITLYTGSRDFTTWKEIIVIQVTPLQNGMIDGKSNCKRDGSEFTSWGYYLIIAIFTIIGIFFEESYKPPLWRIYIVKGFLT